MDTSTTKEFYFTGADFIVFASMLMVSSGIGLYFAFKNRKNHSNKEFLTANKSLGLFPVAMSLLASFQSSVTILGYPAEMFYRGTQFWMVILSSLLASTLAAELFLPVFYKLGFTSVNMYLEERFRSKNVRLAVSFSFLLCTVPYMGVVLYGPSLALETVTGLSVTASILIIGGICTLYTSIGGIKAVVWTDVVQVFLMFAGLFVVMIRGFYLSGGVSEAFKIASRDDRIQFFNFNFDLYSTTTLWNTVIGMGIMWSGNYATSQTEVQRYCNVSTERKAKFSLYLNFIGVALLISCACLCGISLYGYYATCDPLKLGAITKTDQLMPYFVMHELRHLPGMAGLFVSCVFSASLSTMSSGFNALATVTYDDFLRHTSFMKKLPERKVQMVSKLVACFYGLFAILMAFVVSRINSILEAAISIAGALVGPMFGLFLLGVLCPLANSFGVLCGLFTGEIFGIWLLIGSLTFPKKPQMLPTSIDQCFIDDMFNSTTTFASLISEKHLSTDDPERTGMLRLYHVAYLLVPVFGCFISLIVGFICSLLSGGCRTAQNVRPEYLNKIVWYIWPASLVPKRSTSLDQLEYGVNKCKGDLNYEIDNNDNHVKPADIQFEETSINKTLTIIDQSSIKNHEPTFDNMKRSRIIKQNAFEIEDAEDDDSSTKILAYRPYSPVYFDNSVRVTPSPLPSTSTNKTNSSETSRSTSSNSISPTPPSPPPPPPLQ